MKQNFFFKRKQKTPKNQKGQKGQKNKEMPASEKK